jgi:hypothetical protein
MTIASVWYIIHLYLCCPLPYHRIFCRLFCCSYLLSSFPLKNFRMWWFEMGDIISKCIKQEEEDQWLIQGIFMHHTVVQVINMMSLSADTKQTIISYFNTLLKWKSVWIWQTGKRWTVNPQHCTACIWLITLFLMCCFNDPCLNFWITYLFPYFLNTHPRLFPNWLLCQWDMTAFYAEYRRQAECQSQQINYSA